MNLAVVLDVDGRSGVATVGITRDVLAKHLFADLDAVGGLAQRFEGVRRTGIDLDRLYATNLDRFSHRSDLYSGTRRTR